MTELTEVDGIGSGFSEKIEHRGYETVEELVEEVDVSELTDIPRINQEKAVTIIENAEEVVSEASESDAEEFDLTDDEDPSEDDEEPQNDSDDVTEETEDTSTFKYSFVSEREYEWFKYIVQHATIRGRYASVMEELFEDILESEEDYVVEVEVSGRKKKAFINTFSNAKTRFQNERKSELVTLSMNILDEF